MRPTAIAAFIVLAGWAATASAAERARAEVSCVPTGERLVYDCTIVLTEAGSGLPIDGAAVTLGADMPSMPMAHNVRPVPAVPAGGPGVYEARIALEMPGDWAMKVMVEHPFRDMVVAPLRFAD